MFNIAQFLEKFKKLGFDKESQKKIIIDSLREMNIPVEDISIKNKVVTVRASSIVKNQIFMKKAKILEKIPNIIDII
ncbi:MAG: hypothetical protein KBD47_01635 [Candidatus Pacebacteria bacterium]|jgi:hypothetical protein|nr:hypothetical protein [Candidatus Paceibacterota bacterium]